MVHQATNGTLQMDSRDGLAIVSVFRPTTIL